MQCGIDPGYVLDRMEFFEMEALVENIWMKNKESWEQTRTVAYVTAQVQSTKPLEKTDIMVFPWEKVTKVEDTPEDREALRKEMKEWEKIMNKKKTYNR